MTRTKWTELRDARLAAFSDEERAEYERGYRAAALAASIGEQIRAFREEASLTQRELAERMGTSQAAIARLEAGGARCDSHNASAHRRHARTGANR